MNTPLNAHANGIGSGGRLRRFALPWMAACSSLLMPGPGQCYSWDYAPTVGTGISYETNPYYTSFNRLEDDAYSAFADAAVDISAETGRSRIAFRPRTHVAVYTGTRKSSDLNATDFYLPLDGFWSTPRVRYSLSTGYSQVSTRNSEVFVTDPNTPSQGGVSGRIVSPREDQDRTYFYPSLNFRIGPRDALGVTLNVDDVRYTEAQLTGRSNYVYGALSPTWTHSLDLKSRITSSVNVNEFKADRPGSPTENKTISYGFDGGYEYSLSDVTTVGLSLGASHSDVDITGLATVDADNNPATPPVPCFDPQQNTLVLCELKTSQSNFVGRVFLTMQTAETISTQFSVSRSLQPNSDGAQVTQDEASAYVTKTFTPLLSSSLGVNYIRQQAVGQDVAGTLANRFDREYARIDASLTWRLSQTWSLSGNYSLSHDAQKSGATYTTDNNFVSVQLQYAGLGKH